MSFWEKLKPAPKPPTATMVQEEPGGAALRIQWEDGLAARIPARLLRQICPCAECVDEWTRKRTFDPEKIPAEMKILEVSAVGNYAVAFKFSDAHTTGIFQWETLRDASEPKKADPPAT